MIKSFIIRKYTASRKCKCLNVLQMFGISFPCWKALFSFLANLCTPYTGIA